MNLAVAAASPRFAAFVALNWASTHAGGSGTDRMWRPRPSDPPVAEIIDIEAQPVAPTRLTGEVASELEAPARMERYAPLRGRGARPVYAAPLPGRRVSLFA